MVSVASKISLQKVRETFVLDTTTSTTATTFWLYSSLLIRIREIVDLFKAAQLAYEALSDWNSVAEACDVIVDALAIYPHPFLGKQRTERKCSAEALAILAIGS
jgi:hypothetical protein